MATHVMAAEINPWTQLAKIRMSMCHASLIVKTE